MTDIEKYKSVAIKIDAYKKAKPMAEQKYMVISVRVFLIILNSLIHLVLLKNIEIFA